MHQTIIDGLIITGTGVSFVISFLCILIIAMCITSKVLAFIGKYFPEPAPEVAPAKNQTSADNNSIIAAVIAAAKRYQ